MAAPQTFIRPDEFLRSLGLRAGETVVHLGCGAGFYLVPAAELVGKTGKVYGIDLLPDMLAEAENRAQQRGVTSIIRTIRADLEQPNGSTLADASADWVLVANILHQADSHKVLAEAKRIVKPTGTVVILEWESGATPFGPPVAKRLSKAQTMDAAQQLGFTIRRELTPSPYHYGLLLNTAR